MRSIVSPSAALTVTMIAAWLGAGAPAWAQPSSPADPPPGRIHAPTPAPPSADLPRWHDRAHGHDRHYPAPGAVVRVAPSRARIVLWGGVGYRFLDGVWYAPGPAGFVVVRPPIGIVVADLPPLATAITLAGLVYLYANGVYYREHAGGGYEVVPPPVATVPPPPDGRPAVGDKPFVYPRQNQSAEQQASDEFECHRWAAEQSGFDPSAAATGGAPAGTRGQRSDYQRARTACLEGRGYTVR